MTKYPRAATDMPRGRRLYEEDDYEEDYYDEEDYEDDYAHGEVDESVKQACIDALHAALGDSFTDSELRNAAGANGWDVNATTAWLLEPAQAPKPVAEPKRAPNEPPSVKGLNLASPSTPAAKSNTGGSQAGSGAKGGSSRSQKGRGGGGGGGAAAAQSTPAALPPPPPPRPPPPPSRTLNLVVVGHVDAGKSTLVGRLLFEAGVVSDKAMQKLHREATQAGKGSFAFAWLLDEDASERARGLTVDVARAHVTTPAHDVTILDTPGHRDFVPAMISGAAQADATLLVANASPGEFEAGLSAQTREHMVLCRSLGVSSVVVAVNQIDKINYDQNAFSRLTAALDELLGAAGFAEGSVQYVPCSAFHGDNISKCGEQLAAWWSGPTVLGAIDAIVAPVRRVTDPARASVRDVYKSRLGPNTVAVHVHAGAVHAGDKLTVLPAGDLVVVKAIAVRGAAVDAVGDGDSAELAVVPAASGSSATLEGAQLGPGSVLCAPHAPSTVASEFEAQILTLNLPHPLVKGEAVELHAHSLSAPASVSRLVCLLDAAGAIVAPADGASRQPRSLPSAQNAIVRVRLAEAPVCIETFASCRPLARFSLRSRGHTLVVGIVTAIVR